MGKFLFWVTVIVCLVALISQAPSATSKPVSTTSTNGSSSYASDSELEARAMDVERSQRQDEADAQNAADAQAAANEELADADLDDYRRETAAAGGDSATSPMGQADNYYFRTYAQMGYPQQYSDEVIWIALSNASDGSYPMNNVPVHTVWNYKTAVSTLDWHTGSDGKAAMVRNIGDATCGFTVRVDIYVFGDQEQIDSAYFTPCGDGSRSSSSYDNAPSSTNYTSPPQRTTGPVSGGSSGVCPAGYPIKGNDNSMIYHVPGGQFYNATNAYHCFANEAAAQSAGYRKSER